MDKSKPYVFLDIDHTLIYKAPLDKYVAPCELDDSRVLKVWHDWDEAWYVVHWRADVVAFIESLRSSFHIGFCTGDTKYFQSKIFKAFGYAIESSDPFLDGDDIFSGKTWDLPYVVHLDDAPFFGCTKKLTALTGQTETKVLQKHWLEVEPYWAEKGSKPLDAYVTEIKNMMGYLRQGS